MATSIQSLWPAQIRAGVQSPWAILFPQAEALATQTGGVLIGEVKRRDDDGKVVLTFDIVVPGLDGYRDRILSATYDRERFYPVTVDADIFRMPRSAKLRLSLPNPPNAGQPGPENVADSDQELINLVGKVLQSSQVVSLAQSLIARATDSLAEKERLAQSAADATGSAGNEQQG
jgi:hypothetical protein